MRMNDITELRLQQIDLLESVRTLLFEIEQGTIPPGRSTEERVREMRLHVDREIEWLR